MAGYYKVELDSLAGLITQLGECVDEMRSAMRALKDIGLKGTGLAELEKACDDFQESWGYGIGLIADAADGVTKGLAETKNAYEAIEKKIAEEFNVPGD
ncbi:hypothetical protein AB0N14_24155 [Streptomyces sp. NPDC051104]|uniref:hypothetical protein n=1 Tax=Streptomyces sp. NPDC051104 TaxID=3155044 RepID=UPI00343DA16B